MNEARARKRIQVFYAKDAPPLTEEQMPAAPMDAESLAFLAKANLPLGLGEHNKVLFSEPGEQGFSLVYVWFKSGYILPPHSHSSDCLYNVIAGELRMGSHVLRKGDGMLIPADTAYAYEAGPEGVELLEFRNVTRFNIAIKAQTSHWERIAEAYRERGPIWEAENVPPSERQGT